MKYIIIKTLFVFSVIDCGLANNNEMPILYARSIFNIEEASSAFVINELLENPEDYFETNDYFESDLFKISESIAGNLYITDSICRFSSLTTYCSEDSVEQRLIFDCYSYLSKTNNLTRMSFLEFDNSALNIFLISPLKPLICSERTLIEVRLYSSQTKLRDYVFTIEVLNNEYKLLSTGIISAANRWTK